MLKRSPSPAAVRPAHIGMAVVGGGILLGNVGPIDDLDTYWQVLVGQEILDRRTLQPQGTAWLAEPAAHWASTQWAAEASMALMVGVGGWRAIVVARVIASAAILAALALLLLRRANPALALVAFAPAAFGLMLHMQDRPQTVSLGLMLPLAWLCTRTWVSGTSIPLVWVAVGSLVWAQFHGLWILAPAAFAVTGLGLWLQNLFTDQQIRLELVRNCAGSALASLAGVANPRGLTSFTAGLDFRGASSLIGEWQTTSIKEAGAIAVAVLAALVALGWVCSQQRPPLVEFLWTVAWSGWALASYRNCLPSELAIAPVAAISLQRAFGTRMQRLEGPVGPRERRLLVAALTAAVTGTVAFAGANVLFRDPFELAPVKPIAERLASSPHPVRVFNQAYVGGQLAAFGGGRVRVALDGRYDLFGYTDVRRKTDALLLVAGWRATIDQFRPDAIVVPEKAPLVAELVEARTWSVAQRSGEWVLLLPVVGSA